MVKKKTKPVKKEKPSAPAEVKHENFFADVYDVVRQIPRGRATSYGAIAAYLGTKSAARMVGWAMNGCHRVTPKIPAHRVVNRNGMLSGKAHFQPPSKMEALLKKEGIKVTKDTIIGFEKIFWDPAKELAL
jgi:methylated-DNA-protein-cysteine methyltransferase related protein